MEIKSWNCTLQVHSWDWGGLGVFPPVWDQGWSPVTENGFLAFQRTKMRPQDTQLNTQIKYSKTCLKRPLKTKAKTWFSRPIIAFIKLPLILSLRSWSHCFHDKTYSSWPQEVFPKKIIVNLKVYMASYWLKKRASIAKTSGLVRGGGGGGYSEIFHTYVGSGYFLGFKILNFNIFWGFQKNEYFLGVWNFCGYFLGGHHKIGLVWGSFLCILGSFLRSRYRIGIFFGVAKIPNIFGGSWNSWYFLGVNGRCWVRAYVCGKKLEYPPPPWGPGLVPNGLQKLSTDDTRH